MKLVTVAEMQAIEREADAGGLSYDQMMENAGRGLAELVAEVYGHLKNEGVFGLVGSGNNGGDTLVALAHLAEWGWPANAYLVRPRPEGDPLVTRLKETGGMILLVEDDAGLVQLDSMLSSHAVLLDGVLGTGIKLPLRGEVARVLEKARRYVLRMPKRPIVVAVDLPSGVDSGSGEVADECIPADLTVTMAAVKAGLLRFPANKSVGELRVVEIGLSDEPSWRNVHRNVADTNMVRSFLPLRPPDAHKGTFGTVLVVAGSINYTGAALLAGKSAFRAGAGLVTLAVPVPLHSSLAGHFPEATWLLLPHELGVIASGAASVIHKHLGRPTAMLIGPGFGMEDTTKDFIARLIGATAQNRRGSIGFVAASKSESTEVRANLPPLVIDADGLKLLIRIPGWQSYLPAPAVLTPHPGEMGIMTGLPVDEIQSSRLEVAERYAQEWGHVVVLKGAFTVIASPDGETTVIPVAAAALARAGTGDVLAGLIAGLRAQGLDAFQAAVTGCWIHAQAGLRAAGALGTSASVLAGDVLEAVAGVISDLYRGEDR